MWKRQRWKWVVGRIEGESKGRRREVVGEMVEVDKDNLKVVVDADEEGIVVDSDRGKEEGRIEDFEEKVVVAEDIVDEG